MATKMETKSYHIIKDIKFNQSRWESNDLEPIQSNPTFFPGHHTGVTVYFDPLGSLTPGGQDTQGYLDPRPGYLDPQAAKYPLSGILPADTLIGVYWPHRENLK